jgi:hypothetical protein
VKALLSIAALATLAGDIQWIKEWSAATAQAAKDQKLIFLVIDHPKGGC